MTHPTSQLADYVDGTLQGAERRRIESHLASCEGCATEVAEAARGRDALSSLPHLEIPTGVTSPVLRELRGGVRSSGGSQEPKLQLRMGRVYGLAAASIAAVIALVFVLGGHGPQQQDSMAAGGAAKLAPGTEMHRPDSEPGPLDLDGNYSATELSALAAVVAQQRTGIPVPLPADQSPSGASYAGAAPSDKGLTTAGAPASKLDIRKSMRNTAPVVNPKDLQQCLKSIDAFSNGGTLTESFEAQYDGIPSYFAVILESSEAGQPADKVVIWVLAKNGCDVVAYTQQRYPSATPSPLPTTFLEP